MGPDLTPVTAESFAKWKKERKEREKETADENARQKADAFKKMKAGLKSGMIFSGKELFDFNPDWAVDGGEDDNAMESYERQDSDHEEDVKNQNVKSTDEAVVVNEDLFADEGLDELSEED